MGYGHMLHHLQDLHLYLQNRYRFHQAYRHHWYHNPRDLLLQGHKFRRYQNLNQAGWEFHLRQYRGYNLHLISYQSHLAELTRLNLVREQRTKSQSGWLSCLL